MVALALAVDNTLPVVHPRPYQTMYYRSTSDKIQEWTRVGRASSPVGAFRASAVRLFTGQYMKAVVHGVGGEVLFTLYRKGDTIRIVGMFMLPED